MRITKSAVQCESSMNAFPLQKMLRASSHLDERPKLTELQLPCFSAERFLIELATKVLNTLLDECRGQKLNATFTSHVMNLRSGFTCIQLRASFGTESCKVL